MTSAAYHGLIDARQPLFLIASVACSRADSIVKASHTSASFPAHASAMMPRLFEGHGPPIYIAACHRSSRLQLGADDAPRHFIIAHRRLFISTASMSFSDAPRRDASARRLSFRPLTARPLPSASLSCGATAMGVYSASARALRPARAPLGIRIEPDEARWVFDRSDKWRDGSAFRDIMKMLPAYRNFFLSMGLYDAQSIFPVHGTWYFMPGDDAEGEDVILRPIPSMR